MPQPETGSRGQRADSSSDPDRTAKTQVSQVAQLFARIQQEIEEACPPNAIHFIVDFLCKHYPEHLKGFASIWNADSELERDRLLVVEFFKAQKLPTDVAAHFTNAGFDTLETLCTLTAESLDDIEKFNQTRWLPGHKVRLQQTFADIAGRVRAFTEERDYLLRAASGFCSHPQLVSKQNVLPLPSSSFPSSANVCCGPAPAQSPPPVTYRASPSTPYTTLYNPVATQVVTYATDVARN
ncbi:uncharacterized protein EMH_0074580 [Eimeria mitis]|uniref:Stripes inner membrane complex protein n=1 Tax=Eimeria mitis TaxID=44415 RepID=U6KE27_9EIME|nr:uncharacterized protein EMH_0074580 [Eimeria mitis]CDJ36280.1 hypothetical protein, conserved [Eimeria mitis]